MVFKHIETKKGTRVCFVGWAFPSEHPGSPPLEHQAMHCGLRAKTENTAGIYYMTVHVMEKTQVARCTYLVSPTWSGTNSALHQPSGWLQRCKKQQGRAWNTLLMRSWHRQGIKKKHLCKLAARLQTSKTPWAFCGPTYRGCHYRYAPLLVIPASSQGNME